MSISRREHQGENEFLEDFFESNAAEKARFELYLWQNSLRVLPEIRQNSFLLSLKKLTTRSFSQILSDALGHLKLAEVGKNLKRAAGVGVRQEKGMGQALQEFRQGIFMEKAPTGMRKLLLDMTDFSAIPELRIYYLLVETRPEKLEFLESHFVMRWNGSVEELVSEISARLEGAKSRVAKMTQHPIWYLSLLAEIPELSLALKKQDDRAILELSKEMLDSAMAKILRIDTFVSAKNTPLESIIAFYKNISPSSFKVFSKKKLNSLL